MSKLNMAIPLNRVNNMSSERVTGVTSDNSPRLRRNVDLIPMAHNVNSTTPLLNNPPLASPETNDEPDDRQVMTHPYPGVDDGFFPTANGNKPTELPDDSDIETINPSLPEDIPVINSRAGGDGEEKDDKPMLDVPDGTSKPSSNAPSDTGNDRIPFHREKQPTYPFPSYGPDLEVGSMMPDLDSIPDVNVYQHKKTLAQGMMDLALFSANANQLRYVLETFANHPYYYPSLTLLSISIFLQVAVGIGLIWNATYNVKDKKEICIANKINNFTIIAIFLVTVVNVFISAFGVANPPPNPPPSSPTNTNT